MEGHEDILLEDSFEYISEVSGWDLVDSEPTSQIGLDAAAVFPVHLVGHQ